MAPRNLSTTSSGAVDICGVRISPFSMDEALQAICARVEHPGQHVIVTPNVDHIVRFQKDGEFQRIYRHADMVLADGVPLIWAARFLNLPLRNKISGSDLFPRLCQTAARKGYRVFFLGGRPGAARTAAKVLKQRYPTLLIAGCYCPDFGFEFVNGEHMKICRMIKQSQADILFVGLGSPKQEKWIDTFKSYYKVPVSIGIGVSFEFVAGMVKRAPRWMQRNGLEWFWRLIQEPGRLWKRYLITDLFFFWLVLKQKIKTTGSRRPDHQAAGQR